MVASFPQAESPASIHLLAIDDTGRTTIRVLWSYSLDHVIVLNDRHLRRVRREFVPDYTVTRPHRRRNLEPPAGARQVVNPPGARLRAQPVLGGLHHAYEWAA